MALLDVEILALEMGITIRTEPLGGVLGLVVMAPDRPSVIGVDSSLRPVMRRMTIAVLLGHYVRHRHREVLFIRSKLWIFPQPEDPHVRQTLLEANTWAIELLLPEDQVRAALQRYQPLDLHDPRWYQFAREFDVPLPILVLRLTKLGYCHGL